VIFKHTTLPPTSHPSQVCLKVRSLAITAPFYRDIVGWRTVKKTESSVFMSASGIGPVQLVLLEDANAIDKPEHAVGLYHTAFRFPSRRDLADAIKRVAIKKYPFEGASDHIFSEAVYFSDPEGNGVEIYADRPIEQWPTRDGKVQLINSKALNIENLLSNATPGIPPATAPEGADIGHIHLHVGDIDIAEKFYHNFLGMKIMYAMTGARFLSAGEYHHHIATNVWSEAEPFPKQSRGLVSYRIQIGDLTHLKILKDNAEKFGYENNTALAEDGTEVFRVKDPNGHWLELTT